MVIQPWYNAVDHVLLNGTTVFGGQLDHGKPWSKTMKDHGRPSPRTTVDRGQPWSTAVNRDLLTTFDRVLTIKNHGRPWSSYHEDHGQTCWTAVDSHKKTRSTVDDSYLLTMADHSQHFFCLRKCDRPWSSTKEWFFLYLIWCKETKCWKNCETGNK